MTYKNWHTKTDTVNAMAKTDTTDIISADGVGMSAPVFGCGLETHTLPQSAYVTLSFFSKWPKSREKNDAQSKKPKLA
jgi:hypothetical protein